jgi:alpha/beta superfamily hydrolase
LAIAGYSFGAEVALTVDHPRSVGWFVVAPVLRMFSIERFIAASDTRPKRLVVAQHDQYMPPIGVRESTRGWKQTTIDVARMVDHFFAGGTGAVVASFDQFVDEVTAAP